MADVAPKKKSDDGIVPVLLVLAVLFFARGGKLPSVIPSATQADRATYVYEQRNGGVPPPVLSALNKLNREKKILATALDVDVTDGGGDVPDQYKVAFTTAKASGLPSLVVQVGDKVLKTVAKPTTEEAVLEAVP